MGCPNRIYNMDESGMPLDHKPPKVVARKGTRKVHCHTSGNKLQITVLVCANATGSVLPMVTFEGQRFNPEWSKGEVLCSRSDTFICKGGEQVAKVGGLRPLTVYYDNMQ